eukprot:g4097.t1
MRNNTLAAFNKSTSSWNNIPPVYQTQNNFNYLTANYQTHPVDDLQYYKTDGVRYYSPDCHPHDEVQESWLAAGNHPYVFRYYLTSGASQDALHHS